MRQTFYSEKCYGAFASVYYSTDEQKYWLHAIDVPFQYRQKGIGTELLKKVINEADKDTVVLYLIVVDGGGLTRSQLQKWYRKYGFSRRWDGLYKRNVCGGNIRS